MDPLLIRAIRNEAVERPPVWMMRQAGRYLSEYQEVKSRHTFMEMCMTPELALEVSLQPIRIFDPDAAIVFADILLPLQALGMKVSFQPGPVVQDPIRDQFDIKALSYRDPHIELHYVMQTLSLLKTELDAGFPAPGGKAVIGFAGAPWTMACYMMHQGPHKHFQGTQVFANENPKAFTQLMDVLARLTSEYLIAQIESGADVVQLFDSWAGNLSSEDYQRFALPATQYIFEQVRATGRPCVLYVNGSSHLFKDMLESGANCLSVDWRTSLPEAQALAGDSVSLQGNFDPTQLFGPRETVIAKTRSMVQSLNRPSGYVANLGHGILQQTPRENVKAFVETVKLGWAR